MTTMATILLFGDQTDSWVDGIDQLYKQARSFSWLQSFLNDLAHVIHTETNACMIDSTLRHSLGHFTSLQELGDKYRHTTDELGMARALLLHTVRSGTLLQLIKKEPRLLWNDARSEWLGISGGLISLSALAVCEDFDTLYTASLEVARLLVRLCNLTSVRSRSIEDSPGIWGWAVLGISPEDLRKALDHFQGNMGIPIIKRAQVGVTGSGWSTVIGCPSVLEHVMKQCPALRNVPKNPLNIHALQHTVSVSETDLDYIVGNDSAWLSRPINVSNQSIWGMDNPNRTYANWGDLLRAVCLQVLSRPLDIPQAIGKLNATLGGIETLRVIQLGASSHASYLVGALESPGRVVSTYDGQALLETGDGTTSTGRIAIVGMAGRGPGGDNYEELWDLIMSKRDLARQVPKDRFDINEYYCPEHGKGGKCTMTTKYGCFMDNPGYFDSQFFHISPREAMLMDPGHRQFLMSSYEALEMAGYSDGPTQAVDPNRVAVFYGQCSDDWHETSHPKLGCDAYTLQGVQRAFGPGRLAWQLKWEGPTYGLDSACASTTSSIHLACMSLLSKDIDMAVAGAGNILSTPHSFICLSKSGVLSDTGNCKPYRDDADGYCRGDFVGAIVLKRLEDAVAQNDNILAVVAASGRNHSGNSTSITTSHPGAQERLFRKVLRNAQVSPDDISYVEMHGTGTQIGDTAEMGAVANLFRDRQLALGPLPVGGVKGNFGHSEAAAGMAELLKCIVMFQKDIIPPQAGMPHAINPRFPPLKDINIEIPSEPKAFKRSSESQHKVRRILLNNFDAAGGNACLVLEDYNAGAKDAVDPRSTHVVTTSARTQAAHHANKGKLVKWLRENRHVRLQDLAYSTTARRMHHPIRDSYSASTVEELIAKLEASGTSSASASKQAVPIVFVFTGQGSHYAGMGSELYRSSPSFRETVDLCANICQQHRFPAFLDLITDNTVDLTTKTTTESQLALATLEIGLAAFWKSIGIQPSIVLGHSLGEYIALYVAGVLSLADVLYLIGQRALLLQHRCEAGSWAMLAVSMSVKDTAEHLKSRPQYASCAVACMNSPDATVVSGSVEEVTQLQADLNSSSKAHTKLLPVPYAFHSFQMDPVLADYVSLAEGVTYLAPKIPVASTLLGSIVDTKGTFNARYLKQQMRQPVDFIGALNAIKQEIKADPIWIELGPNPTCVSFVRTGFYSSSPSKSIVSTLNSRGAGPWASISECLTAAYVRGVTIDWFAFHAPYTRYLKMLTLPSYAWDMKDYWITYTDEAKGALAPAVSSTISTSEPIISTCAQYVVEEFFSSSKVQVTLRASLADPAFAATIDGHRMEQEPIAAGSVFCEAAFAVAVYALKASDRESDAHISKLGLVSPNLIRPFTRRLVGSDGELHTTISMDKSSPNEMQVSWKAVSSSNVSYDLGTCELEVHSPERLQGEWDRISHFIKARMDETIEACKHGRGHRLLPDMFYALFSRTVEYAPNFKGVKEAYVSSDFAQAAAEVLLYQDPAESVFTASPYWGESITHLAGFMCNANPQNTPGMTFINRGFKRFEQTVALESGKPYFVYVCAQDQDSKEKSCDVFVFESDGRLVAQCVGLSFHEVRNAALSQTLGGKSKPIGQRIDTASPQVSQNKTDVAVPEKTIEVSAEDIVQASDSTGVFQALVESISQGTGIDETELTDDTAMAEIGVDSIMAIEIISRVSNATGLDLPASWLVDHRTIGDLRRFFDTAMPTSSSELTPSESGENGLSESPNSPILDDDVQEGPATATAAGADELQTAKAQHEVVPVDESSPAPSVRITLLKGRSRRDAQGPPPFYMIADGTGTIATYIHLPQYIKSSMPFYGIDSPFLRCPSRMTPEVGIPGAAKLIVEALVKKHPKGVPYWIGGFSGGAMVAHEVCRQLSDAGHTVDALLLIDMCSPRTADMAPNTNVGLAMFDAISGQDESGVWNSSDATSQHLQALFNSVATYHPPQGRPPAKRAAIIWAAKGMIDRCIHSDQLMQLLADEGIGTEAYPGFMEDPKLGAVTWSLPHKTDRDLGPNGWDKYLGAEALLCLSVAADHLEMPTPGFAHLLVDEMERSFDHFRVDYSASGET